ncbi:MarR family winged helix-turn-helix transcriptional regulator [Aureimonas sp. SK2]|uniref:MarR family winged helix-turn-helix transcriptional regulator n=1 Tax=Aureimonas sp. SK2 TaxID=3015992 RepID=UPI0024452BDB|nr:MarR family transcriptional regulator [Aureimonas sp. SK2]
MELSAHAGAQGLKYRVPRGRTDARHETILSAALATSQSLRAFLGLKLAKLGLASGQDRLLIALADNTSLSVSALADELNVRPSTVSKMMDRLAARGYTQRLPDPADARRINLQLTPDGEEICTRLRTLWRDIDAELTADLSAHEKACISDGIALLDTRIAYRLRRLR